jgi:hypothetical protein
MRARTAGLVAAVLLASAALASCGGGDDGDDEREQPPSAKAVDGTFVGKAAQGDAFVAIVAAPPERGKDTSAISLYVSDGGSLSASLSGTAKDNSFTAASDDDSAKATGKLEGNSSSGTLTLPDGEEVSYRATRATAAAGLYELTVSAKGELSGASGTGVGLTSKTSLRAPGIGKIKFADGKNRKFELTAAEAADPVRLGAGQLRLIVTPEGELSGAGAARPSDGGDELDVFIKSAG